MFIALAEELGIKDVAEHDQYHLVRRINLALLDFARAKKRSFFASMKRRRCRSKRWKPCVCSSNLETEKRKLLHIVLFGQPELDEKLHRPEVRQLLQRIAFHYRLGVLKKSEIGLYVAHRLRVAGYRGEGLFYPGCLACATPGQRRNATPDQYSGAQVADVGLW